MGKVDLVGVFNALIQGRAMTVGELIVAADVADALVYAARNYYTRYCQDEADDEGPHITGCTEQQSKDARALRDALAPIAGAR